MTATKGSRWLKLGLRSSMVSQGLAVPKPGETIMDPHRTISDSDAKAIATLILDEALERFYTQAGKGFVKVTMYVAIGVITVAALFFYVRGK